MARPAPTHVSATRQSIGLGLLPKESRHGFLIYIPKGNLILISEDRGDRFSGAEVISLPAPPPTDPALRVALDRGRGAALAPAFCDVANRWLRANGLATAKLTKSPTKSILVNPSLGKELWVLCRAVEEASIDEIPNALCNWEALAPEERWWLYTMTVAPIGQAIKKGVGWRKAIRAAIADNPLREGRMDAAQSPPWLLGHLQLTLEI